MRVLNRVKSKIGNAQLDIVGRTKHTSQALKRERNTYAVGERLT